jgi:hypothetical protein
MEARTKKEVGMGKVIFDMSMSLDGFIAASNRRPEEPMGEGGEKLHEWGSTAAHRGGAKRRARAQ